MNNEFEYKKGKNSYYDFIHYRLANASDINEYISIIKNINGGIRDALEHKSHQNINNISNINSSESDNN